MKLAPSFYHMKMVAGMLSLLMLSFHLIAMQPVQSGDNRSVTTLQTGWKFQKGENTEAHQRDYDDSGWEQVSVPHDWAITGPYIPDGNGSTGKLPWKGEGWYRKELDIPSDYDGRRIYLIFDGVMSHPEVYMNGKLAGEWDYGYNSFYLDITDFVNPGGDNLLAVYADTRNHRSRWYPGGGIYRKVRMVAVHPVHVDVWGTYITTPIVKPHYADVRIRTTIQNKLPEERDVRVEQVIFNPSGNEIAREDITRSVSPDSDEVLEVTIPLNNPERWDIDNPALYTAKTNVYLGEERVDTCSTDFGVRTIRFTADNGFYLNDRRVQLKGVNLHHGHGPLGAAFYPRAMERKLEIMQEMGINAIRTSHNTEAPEVLELADKMGLLVFNEAFDKWDGTAGITEETDFEDFSQRNIRNFVVRDRNHPSIFLWSVGNEIGDAQWNNNDGFQRLHTMVNYVNRYDPTRPVTMVSHEVEAAALRHFDYYDILAYNYDRRWRLARQLEPNKAVIISESASTVSTRGFYELPLPEEPTDFTTSLQVSSYDLHAPPWAEIADDDFMWQQQEEYIAGEFVWTGFDYLGEPTPYDNYSVRRMGMTDEDASRSSYFGIVDLVGIPKDRFYLYKSYWKQDEHTVHILPHWNWEEAEKDTVPVFVYTNGDCAELFLNDKSLGMRCKDPKSENSVDRFRLMWHDTAYEPGELRAVAYKEGNEIGEGTVRTAGEASSIRLSPDRTAINADGMDLSYILVEAFDRDGNPHPLNSNRIDIDLDGPGDIAGVGNGNPQSFEPFQADYVDLFHGKAMIIIKSDQEPGTVRVTASSNGLQSDSTTITIN